MLSIIAQIEAARVNHAGVYNPPKSAATQASNRAKVLRSEILKVLMVGGRKTTRQLSEHFSILHTTMSGHLRKMIEAGTIKPVGPAEGSTRRQFEVIDRNMQ